MRRFALLLPLLLLLPAAADDAPVAPGGTAAVDSSLTPHVLAVLREYPTDGSFDYYWPKEGGWEGATQDVVYDGRVLSRGDPQRRSYCCGLTYEVYVRALLRASGGKPIPGLTGDDLHELRLRFFGDSKETGERRRLVQAGLESMGLGDPIPHDEARAGDFVQLWRHSGSGHQVIFINWLYKNGERAGLTYWSSQGTTHGIGFLSERFGPDGVDPAQVYIVRARGADAAAKRAGAR